MELPHLHWVTQNFESKTNRNVGAAVSRELERTDLLRKVSAGQTVIITAGSRGIDSMAAVLRHLVTAVKAKAAKPILLPAMGSHGGGTAAGQVAVLEHLGLTPRTMGAPIHDQLDPVEIGSVEGCPVFADRAAMDADHVIIVNRIKEHTEFIGDIESGLIKMTVVGLGRIAGAEVMHQLAVRVGYARALMDMADVLISKLPILGGIAILEDKTNAFRRLEVVLADAIFKREPALLKEARNHHASLPFNHLDLLLVDEIGKDISGAGFDTKVIGRIRNIYEKECDRPRITRIVLRDLSPKTGGNAIGLGLADFIHRRVKDKMDPEMTALNSIVAVAPEKGRVPIALPSDREALEAAFNSIGLWQPDTVRLAWIVNTAELTHLAVSPALAEEAEGRDLSISKSAWAMPFDKSGNLPPMRKWLAAQNNGVSYDGNQTD